MENKWIILEGFANLTQKTEFYKKQGYEHISLPIYDKKYKIPGHTGSNYFEDIIDIYLEASNKEKVIFTKSHYSTIISNRTRGVKSPISDEDFIALKDFEKSNNVKYLLDLSSFDGNIQTIKEPLDLFKEYGFETSKEEEIPAEEPPVTIVEEPNIITPSSILPAVINHKHSTKEQMILEKANAINKILSKRIIKQEDHVYNEIERDVRDFLNKKLGNLLGKPTEETFSKEEIEILKIFALKAKTKTGA